MEQHDARRITAEYCYLVLGYIAEKSRASGVAPSQDVQMTILSLAAKMEAQEMYSLADTLGHGKLQAEALAGYKRNVDELVRLSENATSEGAMNTIVAAARRIMSNAERVLWRMTGIEE